MVPSLWPRVAALTRDTLPRMDLFRGSSRPGRRLPASSPDPVADALRELADVRLARQCDDIEPLLGELPDWIEVTDDSTVDGFDTEVGLHDEVHAYVDPFDSGLDAHLSEQPGIEEVFHEDREVFHLRTRLALADVHAAVVRAVVAANLDPRPPAPEPGAISDAQVDALADAVAPRLEAAGFARRQGPPPAGRYFTRSGEDGFAQCAAVLPGIGRLGDGTSLDDKLHFFVGVRIPEALHPSAPSVAPEHLAPAYCNLAHQVYLQPHEPAVTTFLHEVGLPWLDAALDRSSLAGLVASDPELIGFPAERPKFARLLAEWGHREAASVLLDNIDKQWLGLRSSPDAVAARDLLARG